jgi:alpha-L-rhamnosidase
MGVRESMSNFWCGEWIGWDAGREKYDSSVPYYCADDFDKGENQPFLPPPVLLRGKFSLPEGKVRTARLRVAAYGLADVFLNGVRAVTGHMIPGVCDYRKRVYYREYDVVSLLQEGENAIGAVLADGWYAGYIGLNPRQWWGMKPRLSLELAVELEDSRTCLIVTDEGWKAAYGPWLYADIMHGAGYDARLEKKDWACPVYDDSDWEPVDTGAEYTHTPEAHPGVPVVEHGRHPVRNVLKLDEDSVILDFGVCFSGVLSITVSGEPGACVDILHAEQLKDGDLYLRANRSAQAHDQYILRGGAEEVFQPEFTYHAFRFAKVSGLKNASLIHAEGVSIGSALLNVTMFETQNHIVQKVFDMVLNTVRSNLLEMPTDCCARDERLGWGAEGHFAMHTACYLSNSKLFLRKWLRDIIDSQLENGCFWANAPAVMMKDVLPFAGDIQSDMGIHVSWLLIQMYGDLDAVRPHFPALEKYFAYLKQNSDRLMRFATARDWLDLGHSGRSDYDHGYGVCEAGLIGTVYFAKAASLMADIARALGIAAKVRYYEDMYEKIRAAFRTYFVGRNGLVRNTTQGGALLAVAFGLMDEDEIPAIREWLLKDMAEKGGITWGTASTPFALYGLCAVGLQEEAARFLMRTDFPSIGYMAACGATSIWERWDGILDGEYHPHPMNAFNHIGLATVGAFMVSSLAGIAPLKPGFEKVMLQPVIDREIGSVRVAYHSERGTIEVAWKVEREELHYRCSLPSPALLSLPGFERELQPGEHEFKLRFPKN